MQLRDADQCHMDYCESAFEHLADAYPNVLVDLVASGTLKVSELTFAAEAMGRLRESDTVRRVLSPLLNHESALVREGAVYGVQPHLDDALRTVLLAMKTSDPSMGVREAAADALDDVAS